LTDTIDTHLKTMFPLLSIMQAPGKILFQSIVKYYFMSYHINQQLMYGKGILH